MFLFIVLFIVVVVLWIISIAFNDIEDGLQYYYKASIFDWINKSSWWSWYMMDPDDTWKRKYYWSKEGENLGRKKWMGIPVPAFIYDGWHGAKIIRQFFQYLTVFTGILAGVVLPTLTFPEWFLLFVIALVVFALTNQLTHSVYIFDGIIKKSWWIERQKSNK